MDFAHGADARMPCRKLSGLLKAGYSYVVDADLKGYFDSIPHDRLMKEVRRYIADGRVLGLIEGFLKQDILEGLACGRPEKGTPQGAVISPLLVQPLSAFGGCGDGRRPDYEMIRYADDFVILCREPAGSSRRPWQWCTELTPEKGLVLHPERPVWWTPGCRAGL